LKSPYAIASTISPAVTPLLAHAAERLGQVDADQAEAAHLAAQRAVDAVLVLALLVAGSQALTAKRLATSCRACWSSVSSMQRGFGARVGGSAARPDNRVAGREALHLSYRTDVS
jgi:hypothetical protein